MYVSCQNKKPAIQTFLISFLSQSDRKAWLPCPIHSHIYYFSKFIICADYFLIMAGTVRSCFPDHSASKDRYILSRVFRL